MQAKKRTGPGFIRLAILPATVLALATPLLVVRHLAVRDAEHARFYETGKTINYFLSTYCKALEASHTDGVVEPLLELYSPTYSSQGRGHLVWGEEHRDGDAVYYERRRAGRRDFNRIDLAAELESDLAALAAIDRTKCKIDLIEELEIGRRARLTVKLILDGVDHEGRLLQDRFFYRFELENAAVPTGVVKWRIAQDELVEGVRVVGSGSSLAEVEALGIGIDFQHRRDPKLDRKRLGLELPFGVMEHASGGVAAADYDGDSRPDLLFLDGRELRLYKNNGVVDGLPSFTDITAAVGLSGIGEAHSGLFADFDNDGDRDLFVARYLASNLYFRHDAEDDHITFTEVGTEMGLDAVVPAVSSTVFDYDRDGDLDLYVGVYGNAFEGVPRLPFFARNGGHNRLYRNDGDRFHDVSAEAGVGDPGWSLAVAASDYDGDGWSDLAVANDFGRKNLYRNNGPGADGRVTFSEVADEAGALDFGAGMGLAFADFNDDGRPDLYTSNIHSNQRWFGEEISVRTYLRHLATSRWAVLDALEYFDLYRVVGAGWSDLFQRIGKGNTLLRNNGDGSFSEIADSRAVIAGWGWGVAFFDLDHDNDLDLYAANGWISNTPQTDL